MNKAPRPARWLFSKVHNGLLRDICDIPSRSFTLLQVTGVGQLAQTIGHARVAVPADAGPRRTSAYPAAGTAQKITLSVHQSLEAVEADWRRFEQTADGTPFQTFDWLSAWQRHIGVLTGVTPAIVIAKRGDAIVFLLPLAIERGTLARRLTFLGAELCDYNAPLLAPDFSSVVGANFPALWSEIGALLQATPALRHDTITLTKMPAVIGAQKNPMLGLAVHLNPSGAYETALGTDWEAFYTGKRSSATRRRDRTKLKKLGEMGEVKFVNPDSSTETGATLETLIAQKSKQFGRMGVPDIFARPGYVPFFRELAAARQLVHISRLDVGETWAAVNFGLTYNGCYYHVLAAYDDGDVSRFGPGAAHLRELLKRATELGFKRFDFTIGDEPYKRDWCEAEQQLFDHSAAATLRGVPTTAFALAWRSIKRTIKHTAFLWNAAVRVRSALAALRKQPEPKQSEP